MIINTEKIREFCQDSKSCYVLRLNDNSVLDDTQIVIKTTQNTLDIHCKDFMLSYNIETKEAYLNNIHKTYREKNYIIFENSLFTIKIYPIFVSKTAKLKLFFENVLIFEDLLHLN